MANIARDQIRLIQHALARRGFDPGPVDGIWGRATEGAVRRFQATNGLLIDGVVGQKTMSALVESPVATTPADSPSIPWFQEARRLIGVTEKVGPGNEPRIIDWAVKAGIDYRDDDVPWCGLFVSHCISATLTKELLPANPLSARAWMKFGAPVAPTLGAVLVFWRGKRDGWQGHVGLYAGEDNDGAYHLLGGNQGNKVCITRIAKDRLLEARWPASAPVSDTGPLVLAAGTTFFSEREA
jgi:uncharacterized protein (TIGR02594 family)